MRPNLYFLLCSLAGLTACGGTQNDTSANPADSGNTNDTSAELVVKAAALYSPAGHLFIPRGINLQYGDHPAAALPAIAELAATGANIVRLQLRRDTPAADLKLALDAIVSQGMVAMPMYWEEDITCQSSASALKTAVTALWLARWKSTLLDPAYRGKILVNIANEWGSSQDWSSYIRTYRQVIGQFRQAGFNMPLVIDAADCGQNPDTFLQGRASTLQQADAANNLLFSLHPYHDRWNSTLKIEAILNQYQQQAIPLILGEFGDNEFQADGGHNVDHLALMASARRRQLGWIAWSWHGNGSGYEVLDMSSQYEPASLSRRGLDIVYGNDGLQQTAQPLQ